MRKLAPLLCVLAACKREPVPVPVPVPVSASEPRTPTTTTTTPTPPTPSFVGSDACLHCHAKKGPGWRADWHARALTAASPATVVGAWKNTHFVGSSSEAWMSRSAGGFSMRTADATGAQVSLPVSWLIGGKRMQDPLTVLDDGRWQVLPVYYHVTEHAWVDYTEDKQGRLGPEHPFFWTNFRRTANHECLDCHATGVDVSYDAASRRWTTHLVEPGLGCEACHGPGGRHAVSEEAGDIVNPGKLPKGRAFAVCASCHGPRNPLFPILDRAHRFQPGDDYDAHYAALVIVDGSLRSADFFADGRPKTSSYEAQAVSQSRCHLVGGAGCLDCHAAPHDEHFADELKTRPDESCRACHAPLFAAGKAHTHHDKVGCVDCHMPAVVTGVLDRFADHALDVPVPENTVRHGVPNACNACHRHAAEKPDATAAALARLWPTAAARQQRRLRLADAIDEKTARSSLPALSAVVADEREAPSLRGAAASLLAQRFPAEATARIAPLLAHPSALLRARAADALGHVRIRAAGDALLAATADPELAVREAAVASLGGLGDPRAEAPARRLADDPTTAGLARPHYVLSFLAAIHGDPATAERELERVVALIPYHADALVALAGLAMRRGDAARARGLLEDALRFAPDHREARARLGQLRGP